jgi:hypothetical protein
MQVELNDNYLEDVASDIADTVKQELVDQQGDYDDPEDLKQTLISQEVDSALMYYEDIIKLAWCVRATPAWDALVTAVAEFLEEDVYSNMDDTEE